MTYRIPITEGAAESAGRLVAEVVFATTAAPKGVLRATTEDASFMARIEQAMRDSDGLRKATFWGPDGPLHGYDGFWGTALALRLALPEVGLAVDWANVDGPLSTTPPGDIETPPPYDPHADDASVVIRPEGD